MRKTNYVVTTTDVNPAYDKFPRWVVVAIVIVIVIACLA